MNRIDLARERSTVGLAIATCALALGCGGASRPAPEQSVGVDEAPFSEPEPSLTVAPPTRGAIVIRAAYRSADGAVFVAREDELSAAAPEDAREVCAPPRCGFHVFVAPSAAPAVPMETVFVVRPDGGLCEGTTADPVLVGLVDPFQAPTPITASSAEWIEALEVDRCALPGAEFLFGVYPATDARPVELLVREPDEEVARRVAEVTRAADPGERIETYAWRLGDRIFVRLRTCPAAGPCVTNDEGFEIFEGDRRVPREDHMDFVFGDSCCERITGLVDLDGDQAVETIRRDGYPLDMSGVRLQVSSQGSDISFRARLPSGYPQD